MKRQLLIAISGVALLAGCSEGSVHVDSTLAESDALRSAEQVGNTIQLPSVLGAQSPDEMLIIDSVQFSVNEMEIEGDEDAGEEYETEGERRVGIALNGEATQFFNENVPTGTYRTLGLQFHQTDFDGAQGSIYVQGTYNGSAFAYRSTLSPEIEFYLDSPVEVTDTGDAAVSVSFDVAAWFQSAEGLALDPSDGANRAVIENTILHTMTANAAEVEFGDDGEEDGDD